MYDQTQGSGAVFFLLYRQLYYLPKRSELRNQVQKLCGICFLCKFRKGGQVTRSTFGLMGQIEWTDTDSYTFSTLGEAS